MLIWIKDTGIGIAPDLLPRVFDIFVQADGSIGRSHGGMGIGLTLVRRLVEMHGGNVKADSAGPGQGSEFVVRLPLFQREPQPLEPSEDHGRPARKGVSKQRILVVDDSVDAAESLGMLLRLEGQEVWIAHDGFSALNLAQSNQPDLILLDIGMPGMDGYEVARRIRQNPGLENVLLVALTGWGQEEDRRRTREAGFDLHLVKPVEPEILQKLLTDLPKSII